MVDSGYQAVSPARSAWSAAAAYPRPGDAGLEPGNRLGPPEQEVSNFSAEGTYTGFANFYARLGGESALGRPLTGARRDDAGPLGGSLSPGFIWQYLQGGVLELHPASPRAIVQLALVGDLLSAPADRRFWATALQDPHLPGMRFVPVLEFLEGQADVRPASSSPRSLRQRFGDHVLLQIRAGYAGLDYLTGGLKSLRRINADTYDLVVLHVGVDSAGQNLALDPVLPVGSAPGLAL